MNNSYTTSSLRQSATLYRICIQGTLDQRWADSLGGMSISTEQNAGTETVTTLFGQLPDQAALLGILNFLYDLRCSLLLVERMDITNEEDILEPRP